MTLAVEVFDEGGNLKEMLAQHAANKVPPSATRQCSNHPPVPK